jgi:hypothetical protein
MARATLAHMRFNTGEYERMLRTGGPFRDVERRAGNVHTDALRRVGRRTATLYASIRKQPRPEILAVDVVSGLRGRTPYMGYHHFGTAPHVIVPRGRKVLRFIQNGAVRFAKRVRHPGTTGTYYLTRALDAARR